MTTFSDVLTRELERRGFVRGERSWDAPNGTMDIAEEFLAPEKIVGFLDLMISRREKLMYRTDMSSDPQAVKDGFDDAVAAISALTAAITAKLSSTP